MRTIVSLMIFIALFGCSKQESSGPAKVIKGAQTTEVDQFLSSELAPINAEFNGSANYELTSEELDLLLEKGAISTEQHQNFLQLI